MIDFRQRKETGVTLIELMIVLVVAAILMAGVYSLFITQQRSYSVQDQVVGVQQDARVALDLMSSEIRMAGVWIGPGSASGWATNSDASTYNTINGQTYSIAGTTGTGPRGSDSITILRAMPLVDAGGNFFYVQSIANRTVTLDRPVTGLLLPGAYVAFEDEKQVYRILNILPPNDTRIELTDDIPAYIGTATLNIRLYRLGAITYQINGDSLVRDNQPLAGDGTTTVVEDLQIAYGVWNNTAAPPQIDWSNTPPGGTTEVVRITIIVRTAVPDPQDTSFFKPAKEDNAQDNANPGCRRRIYTTEVMLRNLK